MKKAILSILMFVLMVGLVQAAATFKTPAAGGTLSGPTQYVNVSSTLPGVLNCTVTATSALTGETVAAFWLTNFTGTAANGTVDSTANQDSNDYVFTGTCYNSTSNEAITSVTAIIDNTVPICAFTSATVSDGEYGTSQTYTVTATNASSGDIKFGGNFWTAMTCSAGVCTAPSHKAEGTYLIQGRSTDGTNTTACTSLSNVDIFNELKSDQAIKTALQGSEGSNNNSMLLILAVIVVVAIVFNKSKKR